MPNSRMLFLRPINTAIGNLSGHVVSRIDSIDTTITLHFSRTASLLTDFSLQIEDMIGFVDCGILRCPLTAGIVCGLADEAGQELAARARHNPADLLEMRLDFEDETGLISRFGAVARVIRFL